MLTCIGSDALDVIDVMEFDTEDRRKDPEIILEKMENYCIGECNETYLLPYLSMDRKRSSSWIVDQLLTSWPIKQLGTCLERAS